MKRNNQEMLRFFLTWAWVICHRWGLYFFLRDDMVSTSGLVTGILL